MILLSLTFDPWDIPTTNSSTAPILGMDSTVSILLDGEARGKSGQVDHSSIRTLMVARGRAP